MVLEAGPERRTMPMPPRPGGVEMATMVSMGSAALESGLFSESLTWFSSCYREKKFGEASCGVLQGFLRKVGYKTWCFGGEFVVICVVNVVA
jgi:hypothetical protein